MGKWAVARNLLFDFQNIQGENRQNIDLVKKLRISVIKIFDTLLWLAVSAKRWMMMSSRFREISGTGIISLRAKSGFRGPVITP
jgi:hypothetical protein